MSAVIDDRVRLDGVARASDSAARELRDAVERRDWRKAERLATALDAIARTAREGRAAVGGGGDT